METTVKRAAIVEKRGRGKKSTSSAVHAKNPDLHSTELDSRNLVTVEGSMLHGKPDCTTATLNRQAILNTGCTSTHEIGENVKLGQEDYCSALVGSGQLEDSGGYGKPTAQVNDGNLVSIPTIAADVEVGSDSTGSMNMRKRGVRKGKSLGMDVPFTEAMPVLTGMEGTSKVSVDVCEEDTAVEGTNNQTRIGVEAVARKNTDADSTQTAAGTIIQNQTVTGNMQTGVTRGRNIEPIWRKGYQGRPIGAWMEKETTSSVQQGRTFASLLNSNPMERKMQLSFIEPGINGQQQAFFPKEEVLLEAKKKWEDYLVGYFVSGSMAASGVEQAAKAYWGKLGLGKVLADASGFFFFQISDEAARRRILEEGPWLFYGRNIVLQQWSPELTLCKQRHDRIPLWVRFRKVPLNLWTAGGLSGIASLVGRPLYADSYTECMTKIDFARICVEVDANKPLPDTVHVCMAGKVIDIPVEYQWRPLRCPKCAVFGHVCREQQAGMERMEERSRGQLGKELDGAEGRILDDEGFVLVQRKRNSGEVKHGGTCGKASELEKEPEKERLSTGQDRINLGAMLEVGHEMNQHKKKGSVEVVATSPDLSSLATDNSDRSDTENDSSEDSSCSEPVNKLEHLRPGGAVSEVETECSSKLGNQIMEREKTQKEPTANKVVAAMPNDQFQTGNHRINSDKTKKGTRGSRASKQRRR